MDSAKLVIREIEAGEEQQVCLLVKHVFNAFVAPLYENEGVGEFLRYIDPDQMTHRIRGSHLVMIAEKDGNLLGVIEVRDFNHVSLLFVAGSAQRQGIARRLLEEALEICQSRIDLSGVSVHSSPNAVKAYEKLGFKVSGQEQLEHGIRYIPMELKIKTDSDI